MKRRMIDMARWSRYEHAARKLQRFAFIDVDLVKCRQSVFACRDDADGAAGPDRVVVSSRRRALLGV